MYDDTRYRFDLDEHRTDVLSFYRKHEVKYIIEQPLPPITSRVPLASPESKIRRNADLFMRGL